MAKASIVGAQRYGSSATMSRKSLAFFDLNCTHSQTGMPASGSQRRWSQLRLTISDTRPHAAAVKAKKRQRSSSDFHSTPSAASAHMQCAMNAIIADITLT